MSGVYKVEKDLISFRGKEGQKSSARRRSISTAKNIDEVQPIGEGQIPPPVTGVSVAPPSQPSRGAQVLVQNGRAVGMSGGGSMGVFQLVKASVPMPSIHDLIGTSPRPPAPQRLPAVVPIMESRRDVPRPDAVVSNAGDVAGEQNARPAPPAPAAPVFNGAHPVVVALLDYAFAGSQNPWLLLELSQQVQDAAIYAVFRQPDYVALKNDYANVWRFTKGHKREGPNGGKICNFIFCAHEKNGKKDRADICWALDSNANTTVVSQIVKMRSLVRAVNPMYITDIPLDGAQIFVPLPQQPISLEGILVTVATMIAARIATNQAFIAAPSTAMADRALKLCDEVSKIMQDFVKNGQDYLEFARSKNVRPMTLAVGTPDKAFSNIFRVEAAFDLKLLCSLLWQPNQRLVELVAIVVRIPHVEERQTGRGRFPEVFTIIPSTIGCTLVHVAGVPQNLADRSLSESKLILYTAHTDVLMWSVHVLEQVALATRGVPGCTVEYYTTNQTIVPQSEPLPPVKDNKGVRFMYYALRCAQCKQRRNSDQCQFCENCCSLDRPVDLPDCVIHVPKLDDESSDDEPPGFSMNIGHLRPPSFGDGVQQPFIRPPVIGPVKKTVKWMKHVNPALGRKIVAHSFNDVPALLKTGCLAVDELAFTNLALNPRGLLSFAINNINTKHGDNGIQARPIVIKLFMKWELVQQLDQEQLRELLLNRERLLAHLVIACRSRECRTQNPNGAEPGMLCLHTQVLFKVVDVVELFISRLLHKAFESRVEKGLALLAVSNAQIDGPDTIVRQETLVRVWKRQMYGIVYREPDNYRAQQQDRRHDWAITSVHKAQPTCDVRDARDSGDCSKGKCVHCDSTAAAAALQGIKMPEPGERMEKMKKRLQRAKLKLEYATQRHPRIALSVSGTYPLPVLLTRKLADAKDALVHSGIRPCESDLARVGCNALCQLTFISVGECPIYGWDGAYKVKVFNAICAQHQHVIEPFDDIALRIIFVSTRVAVEALWVITVFPSWNSGRLSTRDLRAMMVRQYSSAASLWAPFSLPTYNWLRLIVGVRLSGYHADIGGGPLERFLGAAIRSVTTQALLPITQKSAENKTLNKWEHVGFPSYSVVRMLHVTLETLARDKKVVPVALKQVLDALSLTKRAIVDTFLNTADVVTLEQRQKVAKLAQKLAVSVGTLGTACGERLFDGLRDAARIATFMAHRGFGMRELGYFEVSPQISFVQGGSVDIRDAKGQILRYHHHQIGMSDEHYMRMRSLNARFLAVLGDLPLFMRCLICIEFLPMLFDVTATSMPLSYALDSLLNNVQASGDTVISKIARETARLYTAQEGAWIARFLSYSKLVMHNCAKKAPPPLRPSAMVLDPAASAEEKQRTKQEVADLDSAHYNWRRTAAAELKTLETKIAALDKGAARRLVKVKFTPRKGDRVATGSRPTAAPAAPQQQPIADVSAAPGPRPTGETSTSGGVVGGDLAPISATEGIPNVIGDNGAGVGMAAAGHSVAQDTADRSAGANASVTAGPSAMIGIVSAAAAPERRRRRSLSSGAGADDGNDPKRPTPDGVHRGKKRHTSDTGGQDEATSASSSDSNTIPDIPSPPLKRTKRVPVRVGASRKEIAHSKVTNRIATIQKPRASTGRKLDNNPLPELDPQVARLVAEHKLKHDYYVQTLALNADAMKAAQLHRDEALSSAQAVTGQAKAVDAERARPAPVKRARKPRKGQNTVDPPAPVLPALGSALVEEEEAAIGTRTDIYVAHPELKALSDRLAHYCSYPDGGLPAQVLLIQDLFESLATTHRHTTLYRGTPEGIAVLEYIERGCPVELQRPPVDTLQIHPVWVTTIKIWPNLERAVQRSMSQLAGRVIVMGKACLTEAHKEEEKRLLAEDCYLDLTDADRDIVARGFLSPDGMVRPRPCTEADEGTKAIHEDEGDQDHEERDCNKKSTSHAKKTAGLLTANCPCGNVVMLTAVPSAESRNHPFTAMVMGFYRLRAVSMDAACKLHDYFSMRCPWLFVLLLIVGTKFHRPNHRNCGTVHDLHQYQLLNDPNFFNGEAAESLNAVIRYYRAQAANMSQISYIICLAIAAAVINERVAVRMHWARLNLTRQSKVLVSGAVLDTTSPGDAATLERRATGRDVDDVRTVSRDTTVADTRAAAERESKHESVATRAVPPRVGTLDIAFYQDDGNQGDIDDDNACEIGADLSDSESGDDEVGADN